MDQLNLSIAQGKTFSRVLRYTSKPYLYRNITAVANTAPARITVPAHGLVDGQRVAVVSVKGMTEINASRKPPRPNDYLPATVIDVDTVELNDVNAADFGVYVSGGYLQCRTPVSLAGCVARMTIRDSVGGTALLSLDSASLGGIVLDNTAKTITVTIAATVTAAMTWTTGVYELEIQFPTGVVKALVRGDIEVCPKEIAT